MAEYVTLKSAP